MNSIMENYYGEDTNMKTTDDVLEARARDHGRFADNARIAQALKGIISSESCYHQMPVVARESLDMIASKIARIVSSAEGVHHIDNWTDIAGYARLAEKYMINIEEEEGS